VYRHTWSIYLSWRRTTRRRLRGNAHASINPGWRRRVRLLDLLSELLLNRQPIFAVVVIAPAGADPAVATALVMTRALLRRAVRPTRDALHCAHDDLYEPRLTPATLGNSAQVAR